MICQYCGHETEPKSRWHERGDCPAVPAQELPKGYVWYAGQAFNVELLQRRGLLQCLSQADMKCHSTQLH